MLGDVIVRPIITERSMDEAALGKFTFQVVDNADKKTIKKAVEKRFKVNVKSVSTVVVKGKKRRAGIRRVEKVTSNWKKAVVRVAQGQKIDLFEIGG